MKKQILFIVSIFIFYNLSAQKDYSKEALIADFREYITFLEETHPDPYHSFGGKMQFNKEIHTIINDIPENGLNENDFKNIISEFSSKLHDGHTFVLNEKKQDFTTEKVLNLKFKILSDGYPVWLAYPLSYNSILKHHKLNQ